MKILVTGGAGFIGSHLVEALLAEGHTVCVIDDFNDFYDPLIKRQNLQAFISDIRLHTIDLRDKNAILDTVSADKPDAIVHLAARAGVRPSIAQPELYIETNITGTCHLLEASKACGVERFIFGSSSSVYGASRTTPFREDQVLTQTLSPYAATKVAGEHLCSNYSYLYGIRAICLRFFTVFGPRQRPDLAIHKFTALMEAGKPIPVFGDGSTGRDYTYVGDIVAGVLAALGYEPAGKPAFDILNLGNSHPVKLSELIAQLEAATAKKAVRNQQPAQPGDVSLTWADISKAGRLLGYAPRTSLAEGLKNFVEWYRASAQ